MAAIELNRFEFLWWHRAFHHEGAPAFDLGLDKAIAGKEPLNAVVAVRFYRDRAFARIERLVMQAYTMLGRELIDTAVTRAKKLLVLVGPKKALAIAAKRRQPRRRSLLRDRLAAGQRGDRR